MVTYSWMLGLSAENAMYEMNADVESHVEHARRHGAVFWDRNAPMPAGKKAMITGGYLLLWEPGGRGIHYRFRIEEIFDGPSDFARIRSDPNLSRYVTPNRDYTGKDQQMVLSGEKCNTWFLCKDPERIGPHKSTDYRKWDGKPVKAKFVRGNGIGVIVDK